MKTMRLTDERTGRCFILLQNSTILTSAKAILKAIFNLNLALANRKLINTRINKKKIFFKLPLPF
jgi:hypothetical protein